MIMILMINDFCADCITIQYIYIAYYIYYIYIYIIIILYIYMCVCGTCLIYSDYIIIYIYATMIHRWIWE
jgi:hypothetical protein